MTERSGEVVTKKELFNKIWADSFVEESNLSRHIYVLRKIFKDLGEKNFIQTVPPAVIVLQAKCAKFQTAKSSSKNTRKPER